MTSETGHSKNVANLEDIISFCTAYGATYSPSKETLQIEALNELFSEAQDGIRIVTFAKNEYDIAIGERREAFEPLKQLATKIGDAFSVTEASDGRVNDARSINRKLQGKRSSPKPGTIGDGENTAQADNSISTTQLSYDSLLDHFHELIELVSSEPSYSPNEADLKVIALTSRLNELREINSNVIHKYTAYSNAMIKRDSLLYANDHGLVDIALEVKKYVKSVYGATSPQYNQVSGIEFSRGK